MAESHTAIMMACTNRPKYAEIILRDLAAQSHPFDLYLILNSPNSEFAMTILKLCDMLEQRVVFIKLASSHSQIGVTYNCGLWHARHDATEYDYYMKVDDDLHIRRDDIAHLHELAMQDEYRVVGLPPWNHHHHYGDQLEVLNQRFNEQFRVLYGCCWIAPRAVFDAIGYFSEDSQRGMDVDFSIRLQRANFEIFNSPTRCALHLGANRPTEGEWTKKFRKSVTAFGKVQVWDTIWQNRHVRQRLIDNVNGWAPRQTDETTEELLSAMFPMSYPSP